MSAVRLLDLPAEILGEIIESCEDSLVISLASKECYELVSKYRTCWAIYVNREEDIVRILSTRCHGVESLEVPYINCRIWNTIVQHCPAIESLRWNSRVMSLKKGEVPLPFPSLRTIELRSNPVCYWVFSYVPGLENLEIAEGVIPTSLLSLMPQLHALSLTYYDVSPAEHACLVEMLTTATQLTSLSLSDYSSSDYGKYADTKPARDLITVELLKKALPKLTTLRLRLTGPPADEFLRYLNPQREKMEEVWIADVSVKALTEAGLPPACNISSIDLKSMEDAQLVSSAFTELPHVTIECDSNWPLDSFSGQAVIDDVRLIIAETAHPEHCIRLLAGCSLKPLQELSLKLPVYLTEPILVQLAESCPQLTSLTIETSKFQFTRSLVGIATFLKCTSLTLENDDFSLTRPLDDNYTVHILSAFPDLTTFCGPYTGPVKLTSLLPIAEQLEDISGDFRDMTENPSLLTAFKNLRKCSFHTYGDSSENRLSDCAALFAVLSELRQLVTIQLSSSVVRSAPLRQLLTSLPRLRSLFLWSSTHITPECVPVLCELGTGLRDLRLSKYGLALEQQMAVVDALKEHTLQSVDLEYAKRYLVNDDDDTEEKHQEMLRDEKYAKVAVTIPIGYLSSHDDRVVADDEEFISSESPIAPYDSPKYDNYDHSSAWNVASNDAEEFISSDGFVSHHSPIEPSGAHKHDNYDHSSAWDDASDDSDSDEE